MLHTFSQRQIENIKEIKLNLVSQDDMKKKIKEGSVVIVKGRITPVAIGYGMLGKVITPIGLGTKGTKAIEVTKIKRLVDLSYGPDIIIDLSIYDEGLPLYEDLINLHKGPIATVPTYRVFKPRKGIDPEKLFDEIEKQAQKGVSYMVIHAAVTKELFDIAHKIRKYVPYTSRGGSCVIRDMIFNGQKEGIYIKHYDRLLGILKKYGVTLSLATSFRPASNIDANDIVHFKEFELQAQLIKRAREAKVPVILEAVTHANLQQMLDFKRFINTNPNLKNVPLGSLGPLGTDAVPGYDHIVMAATASFAYFHGICHFVTPVTRVEHTGGVPSEQDAVDALRAIRTAFRVGEVGKYPQLDSAIGLLKGTKNQTCILYEGKGLFPDIHTNQEKPGPCTRCGGLCPYLDRKIFEK